MSTVTIDSSRFGTLEIASEDVIEFPNGLIGLGGRATRSSPPAPTAPSAGCTRSTTRRWRCRSPTRGSSSPTTPSSCPTRTPAPITADPADVAVWVTVRAGAELADFYANLRAPILVADGQGHQVINEAADAPVRAPLFPAVAAAA